MNECHKTFEEGEVPKNAIPLEATRAWMRAQPDTE
jgi:membrane-bound lytic murein transglycosylase